MKKLNIDDLRMKFGNKRYAVKCDKWDIEAFNDIKDISTSLTQMELEGRKLLDTFPELMQDVFDTMYKGNPKLSKEYELETEMLFNYSIMKQVMGHRRIKEMRALSALDPISSAMGVEGFSEELKELVEELKEQRQQYEDMMAAQQEYEDALEEADAAGAAASGEASEDGEDGEGTEAPELLSLKAAKERLEETKEAFKEGMEAPEIHNKIGKAIARVKDQVVKTNELLQAWGATGDESFQQMGHRNKMELINKIQNSPKLKKIAEIAGRLMAIALSQQQQKIKRGSEEVYDVEMGRDLSRVLPTELAKLQDPNREAEFLRDFAEGRLLQYALKGKEKKARGPIVVAIDESGSMMGSNEEWSKAVAICLLNIAQKQKRNFYVIHFDHNSNPESLNTHVFMKTDPPSMAKLIEMAEHFEGGGTDFESPLTRARMCIEDQEGFHKADIVFITDGSCAVRDSWLKDFNKWRKEKKVSIISILMDAGYNSDSAVKEFSTSVHKLSEMKSNGEDIVMDVFASV